LSGKLTLNLITPLIAKLFSRFIEMSNLGMVMRQGQRGIMIALSPPCLLFKMGKTCARR